MACICLTGGITLCPMAAMELILGLTSIHLVMETGEQRVHLRMVRIGLGRSPALGKEVTSCREFSNDSMSIKYNFEKQFLTVPNSKSESSEEVNNSLAKNNIVWYADGSKIED